MTDRAKQAESAFLARRDSAKAFKAEVPIAKAKAGPKAKASKDGGVPGVGGMRVATPASGSARAGVKKKAKLQPLTPGNAFKSQAFAMSSRSPVQNIGKTSPRVGNLASPKPPPRVEQFLMPDSMPFTAEEEPSSPAEKGSMAWSVTMPEATPAAEESEVDGPGETTAAAAEAVAFTPPRMPAAAVEDMPSTSLAEAFEGITVPDLLSFRAQLEGVVDTNSKPMLMLTTPTSHVQAAAVAVLCSMALVDGTAPAFLQEDLVDSPLPPEAWVQVQEHLSATGSYKSALRKTPQADPKVLEVLGHAMPAVGQLLAEMDEDDCPLARTLQQWLEAAMFSMGPSSAHCAQQAEVLECDQATISTQEVKALATMEVPALQAEIERLETPSRLPSSVAGAQQSFKGMEAQVNSVSHLQADAEFSSEERSFEQAETTVNINCLNSLKQRALNFTEAGQLGELPEGEQDDAEKGASEFRSNMRGSSSGGQGRFAEERTSPFILCALTRDVLSPDMGNKPPMRGIPQPLASRELSKELGLAPAAGRSSRGLGLAKPAPSSPMVSREPASPEVLVAKPAESPEVGNWAPIESFGTLPLGNDEVIDTEGREDNTNARALDASFEISDEQASPAFLKAYLPASVEKPVAVPEADEAEEVADDALPSALNLSPRGDEAFPPQPSPSCFPACPSEPSLSLFLGCPPEPPATTQCDDSEPGAASSESRMAEEPARKEPVTEQLITNGLEGQEPATEQSDTMLEVALEAEPVLEPVAPTLVEETLPVTPDFDATNVEVEASPEPLLPSHLDLRESLGRPAPSGRTDERESLAVSPLNLSVRDETTENFARSSVNRSAKESVASPLDLSVRDEKTENFAPVPESLAVNDDAADDLVPLPLDFQADDMAPLPLHALGGDEVINNSSASPLNLSAREDMTENMAPPSPLDLSVKDETTEHFAQLAPAVPVREDAVEDTEPSASNPPVSEELADNSEPLPSDDSVRDEVTEDCAPSPLNLSARDEPAPSPAPMQSSMPATHDAPEAAAPSPLNLSARYETTEDFCESVPRSPVALAAQEDMAAGLAAVRAMAPLAKCEEAPAKVDVKPKAKAKAASAPAPESKPEAKAKAKGKAKAAPGLTRKAEAKAKAKAAAALVSVPKGKGKGKTKASSSAVPAAEVDVAQPVPDHLTLETSAVLPSEASVHPEAALERHMSEPQALDEVAAKPACEGFAEGGFKEELPALPTFAREEVQQEGIVEANTTPSMASEFFPPMATGLLSSFVQPPQEQQSEGDTPCTFNGDYFVGDTPCMFNDAASSDVEALPTAEVPDLQQNPASSMRPADIETSGLESEMGSFSSDPAPKNEAREADPHAETPMNPMPTAETSSCMPQRTSIPTAVFGGQEDVAMPTGDLGATITHTPSVSDLEPPFRSTVSSAPTVSDLAAPPTDTGDSVAPQKDVEPLSREEFAAEDSEDMPANFAEDAVAGASDPVALPMPSFEDGVAASSESRRLLSRSPASAFAQDEAATPTFDGQANPSFDDSATVDVPRAHKRPVEPDSPDSSLDSSPRPAAPAYESTCELAALLQKVDKRVESIPSQSAASSAYESTCELAALLQSCLPAALQPAPKPTATKPAAAKPVRTWAPMFSKRVTPIAPAASADPETTNDLAALLQKCLPQQAPSASSAAANAQPESTMELAALLEKAAPAPAPQRKSARPTIQQCIAGSSKGVKSAMRELSPRGRSASRGVSPRSRPTSRSVTPRGRPTSRSTSPRDRNYENPYSEETMELASLLQPQFRSPSPEKGRGASSSSGDRSGRAGASGSGAVDQVAGGLLANVRRFAGAHLSVEQQAGMRRFADTSQQWLQQSASSFERVSRDALCRLPPQSPKDCSRCLLLQKFIIALIILACSFLIPVELAWRLGPEPDDFY